MFSSLLLAGSCEQKITGHQYISFVNRTDEKIACQIIWIGKITPADTIFQRQLFATHIPANSTYLFECGNIHRGKAWEDDFKVIPYIQFLILNDNIYQQYYLEPCDTIRKYVPILHRYQLTLEDLQRMDWTVVYPPKEY
ncbi:MAG: hypothetical protein LBR10_13200 [Prevotellaceae bacterium]|nr:hypothetical protein [Prevotellaceae bacterium]